MNNLLAGRMSLDIPTKISTSQSQLMPRSLSSKETMVLDMFAPSRIPREKVVYGRQWDWHPKGTENYFEFEKIGIWDTLSKLKWGQRGSIIDSEIHLLYLPNLPMEMYRGNLVEISLTFEGSTSDDRILSKAVFPSPLHTHVIFYPGHSFSVKMGSKFPWKIKISTDADIDIKYPIADILVFFKGYNTPVSQYSSKSGADIISLIPIEENPTGLTLSKPREGGKWITKGIHFGVRDEREVKAMILLQETGIDIEGLHLVGRIKDAMKISMEIQKSCNHVNPTEEIKQVLRNKLYKLLIN